MLLRHLAEVDSKKLKNNLMKDGAQGEAKASSISPKHGAPSKQVGSLSSRDAIDSAVETVVGAKAAREEATGAASSK